MSVLGIDIGGTGCKVAAYTYAGELLGIAYREYFVEANGPIVTLDPEAVWQGIVSAIQKVLPKCAADPAEAVSVSAMGDTFTPILKNGETPFLSIMSYDARASAEMQAFSEIMPPDALYDITGMPLHPMYPLFKIMWINKNRPDISDQIWKYLCYEEYILWRLGARPACSYSTAGRTMLFNNRTKTWDTDLLRICNIDVDKLPEACPSGTVVGTVSRTAADQTGLSENVKLVTGGFDQACCASACGIFSRGNIVDTTGTNEILFFITGEDGKNALYENNLSFSPHVLPDCFSSFGHLFNAGGAFKWYRNLFYEKGQATYDDIVGRMPEDPTNLYFMPFLSGMGTPEMRHDKRALVYGLSLDTDKDVLSKAVLEGVTYELKYNIALIASITSTPNTTIKALGGATKSSIWMQLKADITGVAFECYSFEAGVAGAAMIACVGSGHYPGVAKAYAAFAPHIRKTMYQPRPDVHRIYTEKYEKYCQLRDAYKTGLL